MLTGATGKDQHINPPKITLSNDRLLNSDSEILQSAKQLTHSQTDTSSNSSTGNNVQAGENTNSGFSNTFEAQLSSTDEVLAEKTFIAEPTSVPLIVPEDFSPTPSTNLWSPSSPVPTREPTPSKTFERPTITPGVTPIALPLKPKCNPGTTSADFECPDSQN